MRLLVLAPIFALTAAAGAQTPRFEAVSVKRCADDAAGGRSGAGAASSSPVRLELKCRTVANLIETAYGLYADGKWRPGGRPVPVSGGPAWIRSERYDIEAQTEAPQSGEMMRGPMLQAVLEERFQVKVHRETKEIPVYELTVAKGGPKLQAAQEGKCVARDLPREQRPAGLLPCGLFAPSSKKDGVYAYGVTMPEFCTMISAVLDRDVADKTGIAGTFDIFVGTPEADGSGDDARTPTGALGAAIFSAVQKVGLGLRPAKGLGEFLVIDRVERPSEN